MHRYSPYTSAVMGCVGGPIAGGHKYIPPPRASRGDPAGPLGFNRELRPRYGRCPHDGARSREHPIGQGVPIGVLELGAQIMRQCIRHPQTVIREATGPFRRGVVIHGYHESVRDGGGATIAGGHGYIHSSTTAEGGGFLGEGQGRAGHTHGHHSR